MSDRARMAGQVVFLTVALAVFWLAFVANLTADDLLLGIPAVLLSVGFAFFAIRKLPISCVSCGVTGSTGRVLHAASSASGPCIAS